MRRLLRAKRWAQKPPSEKRIKLILAILAICLILFGIEYFFGWPEALSIKKTRGRLLR